MVLLPTISFLSLILACLVTKSHLRLVFPMPPSPDFTPNIVPVFKSPHEAAQQSFQLSKTNIHHAICLIGSGRADNAIWVTKSLRDVVNQPISTQTIQKWPEECWMKAVVKNKRPRLTPHHRKERLYLLSSTSTGL